MAKKRDKINRRNFLKTVGAAGLGSVFASTEVIAGPNEPNTVDPNAPKAQEPKFPQVPRRELGKTGVKVASLCLGGAFDFEQNQILLRRSLDWGVNYWDTADCYNGGKSESGIGKFFGRYPDRRKEVFLVSKSDARDPAGIQKLLERSLKRMKTDYIDLYFLHATGNPKELNEEIKTWAEKAKKAKKIRFFGFTTHKNMAQCLTAAARLGWIDAIMTSYNFRLMQDPKMVAAIEACHKAGIGLIAMKVLGHGQKVPWGSDKDSIRTEGDKKLAGHFLKRGFTEGQAKIKVVLEDKKISSTCIGMANVAVLTSNVAAVLDKTKLSQADMGVFKEYTQATCSGYCAGCGNICDRALPDTPYVSNIMRYLMYYNSYGDRDRARELFAQIPAGVRKKLPAVDYSIAEARCPQRLPIAELVAEAIHKLA